MAGSTLLSLWGLRPPESSTSEKKCHETRSPLTSEPWDNSHSRPQTPPSSDQADGNTEEYQTRNTTSLLPNHNTIYSEKTSMILSPPRPSSFLVTLQADPTRLREIKPRVHAFFAKRPAPRKPSKAVPASVKSQPLSHALWPTYHLRPSRSESLPKLARRARRSSKPYSDEENESRWCKPLHSAKNYLVPLQGQQRLLAPEDDMRALAVRFSGSGCHSFAKSISKTHSALDYGKFETQMWTEKWAPRWSRDVICPDAAQNTAEWIKAKIKELAHYPPSQTLLSQPKKRRTEMDDFIVADDDANDGSGCAYTRMPQLLILCGSPGAGKTAAVHCAAAAFGGYVYEVSESDRRMGRDLIAVIEGIGRSHSINSKKCVVLVEDVDVIFESENSSFWPALERLAVTSRRPLVATCQDLGRIPASILEISQILRFGPVDLARATNWCCLVALAEGFVLETQDVANIVVSARGDMRRSLNHCQFWCQLFAAKSSGVDWYPKWQEGCVQKSGENGTLVRVLANGTRIPALIEHPEVLHYTTIPEAILKLEIASIFDRSWFEEVPRQSPEETLSGYQTLTSWFEPDFPPPIVGTLPDQAPVFLPRLRVAMEYATDRELACDLGPFAREMARADRIRFASLQAHAAEGARMTRRAWRSAGIDGRQHLSDHDIVLATAKW